MSVALLVVAKYHEDVSWVSNISIPTRVYDKGGGSGQFVLPNIGRETHTYLTYILDEYPDFPEYVFFSQGNPFDHMENGNVHAIKRCMQHVMDRRIGFKGFAGYSIRCDAEGAPNELLVSGKWAGHSAVIPVGKNYAELFAGDVPASFHCRAPAGLFGVRRERILCRPKEFYIKAMDLVLQDPLDINNTGHAFERLWYLVFNGYAKLNKDRY